MSVPSYPFHSLLLKLPNKGMSFPFPPLKLLNKGMSYPFPPLKLPNKGREEYSKMILFISFHSISFPPPKQSLKNVLTPKKKKKKKKEKGGMC